MARQHTFEGLSGNKYDATVYALRKAVTSIPGVYLACNRKAGEINPLRIGEADDVYDRMVTQYESNEPLKKACTAGATKFCVIPVEGGKDARVAIQNDLIDKYRPRFNPIRA